MPRQKKPCTIDPVRAAGIECDRTAANESCEKCGFNPKEEMFRKEYIKRYGLKMNTKGYYQLIVDPAERSRLEKTLAKKA